MNALNKMLQSVHYEGKICDFFIFLPPDRRVFLLAPSALARPFADVLLGKCSKNQPFVSPRVWYTFDFVLSLLPQLLIKDNPRLEDVCKRVVCVFEVTKLTEPNAIVL